jgi:transketolase
MRNALIETLRELAREDERVFLVTGDLGWSVVEEFAREFPARFLNAGVAEANMAGLAAGLACEGFVPFVYSIATFVSMRGYEQLRNGAVHHQLPVRFVGIGGGFAYGHAGFSHFALEDTAIARTQPGLTVIVPADPRQTRAAVAVTRDLPGPVYFRIGKGGNPDVPGLDGRFALGRPEVVREGTDLVFITSGGIALEALAAADRLALEGISAAVAVLAHLGYRPNPALTDLLARYPAVVTVEEAYTSGGLGALVAQALAESVQPRGCRLRTCGVGSLPAAGVVGSAEYMRRHYGLDAAGLQAAARAVLGA